MFEEYKEIMIWDDTGFLLFKNRYNENSLITEVYTKNYVAEGKSKKDAEQNAAIQCLQNIKKI